MDMKQIKENTKIFSVDEITTNIKRILESNPNLQDVWIKGEVSNFKHPNEKHMYFSLKDENSLIKCAMFYRANNELDFEPKDGMKVVVRGSIDVYKVRGSYQIVIEEMFLHGKGELYLRFLQLKSKLEKQGFFAKEHKKNIPKFPKTIGIATASKGSVIRDIINVIKRRYPHVKLILYPCSVQGEEAKYTIVRGIEALNNLEVDVIIIGRGGGSIEELWPFNEEIVAKAIFNSKIPIISAVGHETDFTLSDFTADVRAPTPSSAAEIAVPNQKEINASLVKYKQRIYNQIYKIIKRKKEKIETIENRPLFKRPYLLVDPYKQILDGKIEKIQNIMIKKTEILKARIEGLNGKINALNPESILERGYSLTMRNDKIISSINNINEDDVISTIVKDGEIKSKVKEKRKNERKNI